MMDDRRTQHVTLGGGTFILIARIMLFFSRPGITDLERDVRALRSEGGELKKAVDSQTIEIKRLHETLNQLRRDGAPGAKADEQMNRRPFGGGSYRLPDTAASAGGAAFRPNPARSGKKADETRLHRAITSRGPTGHHRGK
jgi:hypothetical protein